MVLAEFAVSVIIEYGMLVSVLKGAIVHQYIALFLAREHSPDLTVIHLSILSPSREGSRHMWSISVLVLSKDRFPLGGIFQAERNFSLSCDFSSGTN
jgi:hypothetical protein